MVNTFLGGDVEGRKRYQQLGIPVLMWFTIRKVINKLTLKDLAGVSSFRLPFTLTTAEYIGIQDPVVLTSKEAGEMIYMKTIDLLVGKAVNLARLQLKVMPIKNWPCCFGIILLAKRIKAHPT